jgi:hypothetical protein
MSEQLYDDEQILNWFKEIGYVWVGKREDVCSETPQEQLKRFKLYKGFWEDTKTRLFSITLWSGTSKYIKCDDLTWPGWEDPDLEALNSNNKLLIVQLTISWKNIVEPDIKVGGDIGKIIKMIADADAASPKVEQHHLLVVDRMNAIANSKYSDYSNKYTNLSDVKLELEKIRSIVSQVS